MRLIFISDIHSNLHAFESVLKKIDTLSFDEIFCLGDIVGYNAYPEECLNILRDRNIKSVMGNHDFASVHGEDSWFNKNGAIGLKHSRKSLDEKDIVFLKNLPYNITFEREGISFYLTHGSPRDNLFEYVHPYFSNEKLEEIMGDVSSDVIITGHTHVQMEAKINKRLFLNPGSIGQPRDGIPKSCFMLFDTKDRSVEWFRVSYDIEAACKGIFKKNLPKILCEKLQNGYRK